MITGEGLKLMVASQAVVMGLRVHYVRNSRLSFGRGFPDLVIGGPGGIAFAECKGWREQLTDDQWAWRHVILSAGLEHVVLHPADWHSGNIERMLARLASDIQQCGTAKPGTSMPLQL